MTEKLTIGLSLSLSGAYASMGRQAEAALRLFVTDARAAGRVTTGGRALEVELRCIDDRSEPARCAEIYRQLCSDRSVQVILGPYSSNLTRVAAPIAEQAGKVLVNHGGAADDLYESNHRLLVGVLSPASDYLLGFARLLGGLKFWRKRVAIAAQPTPFAQAVIKGFQRACGERLWGRRGIRIRVRYTGNFDSEAVGPRLLTALRRNRINVLVSAGSFAQDVALMRFVTGYNLDVPVLACVAAGVSDFGTSLGEYAEGIVGPSAWEAQVKIVPQIGPNPMEFCRRLTAFNGGSPPDYPAAQAYAAALLTMEALRMAGSLDQERLRAAFGDLRTTTFYGGFAIDRLSGRQIDHRVLLVQWHGGGKIVIEPEEAEGALELPAGWRLILASFQSLRLSRPRALEAPDEPEGKSSTEAPEKPTDQAGN